MAKTRVGVMLRESITTKKNDASRSNDLVKLTSDYRAWCKQIHVLVESLARHLKCLQEIDASRQQVVQNFATFSKGTPLFDAVGLMPSEDRPASTVCSYASVHDELGAKSRSYAGKFKEYVLDYSIEWQKIVRTRIDSGLKKSEELRRDLDHYQKKVEALRLSTNQAMAKGKSVSNSTQERLARNEQKFLQAKQTYNKVATDLVILMEEVNERSWRDLHPLIIKCAQFDMTLSSDEAKAFAKLEQMVSTLKQVASEKGISPQPRLKDLEGLKPELLSTRPGGVAGLQIEYNGNSDPTALPPGSVGAQGMGGFPVPLSGGMTHSTSVTSVQSAPAGFNDGTIDPFNSMGMLSLTGNAAPAPSYDDIFASTTPMHQSSSSPYNGGGGGAFAPSYRSSSFNDADSAYSGYSALSAPTSLAPPMPPPPPPGSYGLPPMQPPTSTTPSSAMTVANSLDPYASKINTTTSPWAMPSPPNSNNGYNMYGNQPQPQQPPPPPPPQSQMPMMQYQQPMQQQQQQPPPPQHMGYNNQGQQQPLPNQGYNPFGP